MGPTCKAIEPKDTDWNFCPNIGVAYFWAVMFGFLVIAHIVQAIIHRKAYSIVIIISAILQMLVFVFRIISINNPTSTLWYALWFVIILVAPLFTNAYVYQIMGRMVHNFLPDQRLFKIKARRFGTYFVLLDFVAFVIQVLGASSASGDNISESQILTGLHIYMGGVGFQQFFILVFVYIAIRFQRRVVRESSLEIQTRALRLLYVLYTVLTLITVRIIFRLIEYSSGLNSSIPNHEVFMYIFDTTPMWIAILLFNIMHPGRIMPGKESDLPSRKEYKAEKKAAKAAKKAGKSILSDGTSSTSPVPPAYAPNQPSAFRTYGNGPW
ncbi:hypothetical protein NA57DRAFT_64807 [Rhizodiscina lignyota]|uniref:RTA1-domain-containing protein n=1 Tax=Rhizodiscina lignyota TaxID=1504668 RepID=A0A9P4M921_9PEZI|nr:hypothetical protein NA57DRAFT_64807 [Rhizodiscina lignyota]